MTDPNRRATTTTFGKPTPAETLADRARFLSDGYHRHSCQTCGIAVLVRKNSQAHTSIQWTTDPADRCPNYRGPASLGCHQLSESIAAAVQAGAMPVTEQEVP